MRLDHSLSRIERPEPVSTEIARRLLDFLLSGQIQVGERIPSERQLAIALGVGRSAIREAVKPLQLLGLLEVRIGDGTYLNEADSALLPRVIEWGLLLKAHRMLELVEARRYIEVALAGLAAERRDASSLARMQESLERMSLAKVNFEAFVEADLAFHLEIGDAARNSVLSGLLISLRSLLAVWIKRVVEAAGETESSYAEHLPILAAIKNSQPKAAEAAMAAHIDGVTRRLKGTLPSMQE